MDGRGGVERIGLAVVAVLLSPALLSCTAQVGVPADRPMPSASPTSDREQTTGPAAERELALEGQLDEVANRIEQDRAGEDIPGYAGLEINAEASAVDVYWVGEPPEDVRQVAATPPAGVAVNLHAATYDLKAMLAATEKVFDKYGDNLHGAAPTTEGTGIIVEWTADNAKNGPTLESLADAAGMPVIAEISDPAEPADG